jgi:hypothetical protein
MSASSTPPPSVSPAGQGEPRRGRRNWALWVGSVGFLVLGLAGGFYEAINNEALPEPAATAMRILLVAMLASFLWGLARALFPALREVQWQASGEHLRWVAFGVAVFTLGILGLRAWSNAVPRLLGGVLILGGSLGVTMGVAGFFRRMLGPGEHRTLDASMTSLGLMAAGAALGMNSASHGIAWGLGGVLGVLGSLGLAGAVTSFISRK